ncbi:hypothetical protein ACFQE1_15775 [Halobium palmae]|uniref:Uncharacterized protein n=1 Tax=Halobium palmae TaxID=1776492 RepID=A0ABD5S2J6_9EURY
MSNHDSHRSPLTAVARDLDNTTSFVILRSNPEGTTEQLDSETERFYRGAESELTIGGGGTGGRVPNGGGAR